MSGPKTGEITLVRDVLLLAARAVSEAAEMGVAYEERLAHFRQQEMERQRRRQAASATRAAQMTDLRQAAESLSLRCARLSGLLQEDAPMPAAPKAADISGWAAHVRQLEALYAGMEARLLARAKVSVAEDRVQAALAAAGDAPDAEGVMTLYLETRRAKRGEEEAADWRAWVDATLARLEVAPGETLPAHLETLARAVILAKAPARAELLADELRREIQFHRQTQAQIAADSAQAAKWLETLTALEAFGGDAENVDLRLALQAAASGLLPLDAATREQAGTRIAALEADVRERETRAAATVLEQSLRDLGYQVEEVRDTLFAEGGMVHFQRPGWGGHYVRLRVNAQDRSLNFNVVRARTAAADRYASSGQKRQDFIAEERWCAEFPRLMATLAARGMEVNVTRRLPPGELPVQEVAAERLPGFTQENGERRRRKKTQNLPLR
ncbi:MAG: hypothetical protein LBF51_04695 [Zoogloeaceae bacterium]|jgi:hypothetical protein|nr:hypothetical protein [Zoogloeaceae bacterium]